MMQLIRVMYLAIMLPFSSNLDLAPWWRNDAVDQTHYHNNNNKTKRKKKLLEVECSYHDALTSFVPQFEVQCAVFFSGWPVSTCCSETKCVAI